MDIVHRTPVDFKLIEHSIPSKFCVQDSRTSRRDVLWRIKTFITLIRMILGTFLLVDSKECLGKCGDLCICSGISQYAKESAFVMIFHCFEL